MLMKIFLVFIGFLLFEWISAHNPLQQRSIAKQLNKERRTIAKEYNISNMHAMVYDKGLADLAGTKDWRKENKGNRFVTANELNKAFAEIKNMSRNDLMKSIHTRSWEHLNPLQTKIGCAITEKNPENVKQTLCAFGDREDLNDLNTAVGDPGSQCMQGYKNDNGLCSVDKVLAQQKFIAELNQMRRSFAVGLNVSNMHELVIKDGLVKMAEDFIWNGTLPSPGDDWRYTWFLDYHNGAIDVEEAYQAFIKLKEKERNDQQTEGFKTFFREYEHLNPIQKLIECAEKESGYLNFGVMCILGPNNTFKFPRGIPGSKCSKGYVNTDGLCTLVPTPKATSEPQTTFPFPQTTSVPVQTASSTAAAPTDSQNTIHIPYNLENASSSVSPDKVAPPTDFKASGNLDSFANASTEPDFQNETTTTDISLHKSVDPIKKQQSKGQISSEHSMKSELTPTPPSKMDLLIAEYLRNEQDGDLPDDDDYQVDVDSSSNYVAGMVSKIFLITVFLLAGFIDVDANGDPDLDQANFIKRLNEFRRLTAVKYNISDMHELVYEKSFESLVKQLGDFNEFSKTQKDKRWFSVEDYKKGLGAVKIATEQVPGDPRVSKKEISKGKMLIKYSISVGIRLIHFKRKSDAQKEMIAFIAYSETNSLAAPGSKCLQGCENDKGLCVKSRRVIISKATKSGPIQEFDPRKLVDDFNEERRKYAKQTGRKNMHELTLSTDLIKIAEQGVDGLGDCLNRKCRFSPGKGAEGIAYFRKETFKLLGAKNDVLKFINETSQPYIIELEYLNPHQREVGCARMEPDGNDHDIICVFKPEGTFNSWFLSDTTCLRGFSFHDFLCTLDPVPTPQPRPTTVETELDRQILKYKQNEQDGDEPSEEDEVEVLHNSSGFLKYFSLVYVIVVFGY
ncbi:hypothetical protein CAEBREN_24311 [Caenorhabditis brenneri]|uniref:SCP domain-containing protein n=1 Tax=Caenorhabditis brenneri TaxID=135651 RepID=G0MDC1_CAEBE|nr:hypothetical protein CAEBREN_24311 [Caenorhabditis brenneri]